MYGQQKATSFGTGTMARMERVAAAEAAKAEAEASVASMTGIIEAGRAAAAAWMDAIPAAREAAAAAKAPHLAAEAAENLAAFRNGAAARHGHILAAPLLWYMAIPEVL